MATRKKTKKKSSRQRLTPRKEKRGLDRTEIARGLVAAVADSPEDS